MGDGQHIVRPGGGQPGGGETAVTVQYSGHFSAGAGAADIDGANLGTVNRDGEGGERSAQRVLVGQLPRPVLGQIELGSAGLFFLTRHNFNIGIHFFRHTAEQRRGAEHHLRRGMSDGEYIVAPGRG